MNKHLAIAISISVMSSLLVYNNLLINLNPFGWDEAYRANAALAIERGIKVGDLGSFIADSDRQRFYPFGQSWTTAMIFLLFGESIVTARLFGLMFFVASAIMTFLLTRKLTGRDGLHNLLPVVLFITSPFILLFAATSMLETSGIFLTLLAFLLYFTALDSQSPRFYFFTGLAASAAFLIKYNYGVSIILALALSILIWHSAKPRTFLRDILTKNNAVMFLTIAIICGLWLSSSEKILEFGNSILNRGYNTRQPITFYISALGYYTPSPIMYIISLAGFIYSFRYAVDRKIRTMLIFSSLVLILLTLHDNKVARFLMSVVPVTFVLTGYVVSRNYDNIRSRLGSRFKIISTITILLIAASVPSIPSTIHYVNSQAAPIGWAVLEKDAAIGNALDFIYSKTKDFDTSEGCVFGGFNELSFHLIYWNYNIHIDKKPKPFPDFCRPKFLGESYSYGVSSEYVPAYQTYMSNLLTNERIKYVIAIELNRTSRYYHSDYINYSDWEINYVRLMENQRGFHLSDNKTTDGITIKIYLRD